MRIDVEVQSLDEAQQAIEAGADVVMLDNMVGQELVNNAKSLKERYGQNHKFLIESSGGIDVRNIGSGQHMDDCE